MLYDYLKRRILEHPCQTLSDGLTTETYACFLNEAEKLGTTLTGQKFGILCKSELNTARALLACLSAGKTAVLLSYRYGEVHTNKILDTIKPPRILTDSGIWQIGEDTPTEEELSDVALIMCTSGTTGAPKGAMITETNLLTNLNDIETYFTLDETDSIFISRPLYHCAVLTGEFLISLIRGVKIIFHSSAFAPAELLQAVCQQGATVLCGTPTLFYHFSKMVKRCREPIRLRTLAVSGECMSTMVATSMREAFPDARIFNVYGLTEASPRVSALKPELFDRLPLSVGTPLPSLKAKVEEGELLLTGKSIMKGYYENFPATQKALAGGWLHTGDVAEMDEEGRIYIKCRKDNLIIRSGMNIYPQEIENALKTDAGIDDVMAFGKKADAVREKICLQVVTTLSPAQVYTICREKLPPFQLPDEISIVPEIPKNASGKVVRHGKRN